MFNAWVRFNWRKWRVVYTADTVEACRIALDRLKFTDQDSEKLILPHDEQPFLPDDSYEGP